MKSGRGGGRLFRSHRSLKVFVRTLAFSLSKMGSHGGFDTFSAVLCLCDVMVTS